MLLLCFARVTLQDFSRDAGLSRSDAVVRDPGVASSRVSRGTSHSLASGAEWEGPETADTPPRSRKNSIGGKKCVFTETLFGNISCLYTISSPDVSYRFWVIFCWSVQQSNVSNEAENFSSKFGDHQLSFRTL